MSLRFAVNILGAPPLSGPEYAEYRATTECETIVGLGMEVQFPTGQYFSDKLINLGTNRFTFRPQMGVVHRRGKWSAELTASSWMYTDNDEFFNGNQLEQNPLYSIQGFVDYTFKPGLWVGAGIAYGMGGKSTVNGIPKDDPRDAILWGLALGYPISKQVGGQLTIFLSEPRRRWVSTRTAFWPRSPCSGDAGVVQWGDVVYFREFSLPGLISSLVRASCQARPSVLRFDRPSTCSIADS